MAFSRYLRQVGRNIRATRIRRGLRQVDVEPKIGLEYKHYQKIEAGKVNLALETLYRLAKLYRVSVSELTEVHREVDLDKLPGKRVRNRRFNS